MEINYRDRALRILSESTNISLRAQTVLNALIAANPVALRGEPTMVLNSELIGLLGRSGSAFMTWRDAVDEVVCEIARASWPTPSTIMLSSNVFLDKYWMSEDGTFLHFKLNVIFIRVLAQMSSHSARDASFFYQGDSSA
jgi:hypothetical protein